MVDFANQVWETSEFTGTGNVTSLAAVIKTFNAAYGTGGTDKFAYFIRNRGVAGEYEYGTGHLLDATTLVRDTVVESSNADAAVNFSAGIKDITSDIPVTAGALTTLLKIASGKIADAVAGTDFFAPGGTDIPVADGGTGASTLTDGGVLLGSGTSPITAMAVLADGSIIVGDGVGDPVALAAFSSSTGNLLAAKGGTIGQQTIWIPAGAMEPRATTAPATSNVVEIGTSLIALRTMDFATDADDHAGFAIQMPKGWDEGTLIWQAVWSTNGTQTAGLDGVKWMMRAGAYASNDVLTTALGTAVGPAAQDHSATADDIMITAESGALTVAGAPTAEEWVYFEVFRDVSDAGDDLDIDARLHGVKIHYTIDAGTDD